MAGKTPSTKAIKKAISSIPEEEMNDILSKLDVAKIQDLTQKIADKKEQIAKKEYAISIQGPIFLRMKDFIDKEAEWTQTEALGIIEIMKVLESIQKEGVKNNTVFMQALPLEAIHYFLSKSKGKGLQSAKNFIEMWRPIDQALQSAKNDANEISLLEKELAAAQQGIELA